MCAVVGGAASRMFCSLLCTAREVVFYMAVETTKISPIKFRGLLCAERFSKGFGDVHGPIVQRLMLAGEVLS